MESKMTHVFTSKKHPRRVKMINAPNMDKALMKLAERLEKRKTGESVSDYVFGFFI